MLRHHRNDRGASAILVSASLFLLIGFAAIAIDLSNGFNQRRQDQIAADIGVMAGAVETLGNSAQIRDEILDFTRRNVTDTYSDAEWQALWEGCTDSDRASLNGSGFNFVTVPAPAGWSVTRVDCISIDPAGFVRVNIPSLDFDTTFGRVLGVDTLSSRAAAIARLTNRGGGGILPFGLVSTAAEGQHVCLRDSSGGLAEEPCDGPDAGNFGAIESPLYGNTALGTTKNCTGSPKKDLLAINIALGLDHRVIPDPDGLVSNEIQDTCAQMDAGNIPDTLNTFQGLSNGMQEGLATGPVPGGFTPRLQQGSNPKRNVHGSNLDDKPLWEYIDGSLGFPSIPATCLRSTFNNGLPDFDWDGDGTLDKAESWQHMAKCLDDYVNGAPPPSAELFLDTIAESPRFAYVPQFWESDFPSGNGWRHILRYKASWFQATWWKKSATQIDVFHPGEAADLSAGGNWDLIQLSGIVLPDSALPAELRGDPPPGGGLDPFKPELYR